MRGLLACPVFHSTFVLCNLTQDFFNFSKKKFLVKIIFF